PPSTLHRYAAIPPLTSFPTRRSSDLSPELVTSGKLEAWVTKFKKEMKRDATNYAITSYDAVLVIADAVERTAKANKALTRTNLRDRKSTRLNSSHVSISYAVFCLKKK